MSERLILFGDRESEAPRSKLMARLGRRESSVPVWPTARGATARGGHPTRRLLETAMAQLNGPLTDDVLEELAAAFPGIYGERNDDGQVIL
jgi:hypothetical protein